MTIRTRTCFAAGVVVAGSLAAGARADYAGLCAALGVTGAPVPTRRRRN